MHDANDDSNGLQLMRSYQYIFDSPNWLMNLLLGSVCMLIPGIGFILLLGYELEVIESLYAHGDRKYPDFDFGRFLAYLLRGLWVFLAQLLVSIGFMLLVAIPLFILFIILFLAISAGGKSGAGIAVLFVLFFIIWMPVMFLMSFITVPVTLRVGLSQDLDLWPTVAFVRDFWKRVGKELFLALLFLIATALVLTIVGILMLFVGVYPMSVVAGLSQCHLMNQLYRVYLRRGGAEIPLKVEAA